MRRRREWYAVHPKSGGRILFATRSLAMETGSGYYGPVLQIGNRFYDLTRGQARRLARAILRLTEKP